MTTRKNWQCPECKSTGFAVFKTYPYQKHICVGLNANNANTICIQKKRLLQKKMLPGVVKIIILIWSLKNENNL